jgi:hypothetical protein
MVGDAVLGASVTGWVLSHVIEMPLLIPSESELKRMNMLPDVASWTGGTAKPLNAPSSAPDADAPS